MGCNGSSEKHEVFRLTNIDKLYIQNAVKDAVKENAEATHVVPWVFEYRYNEELEKGNEVTKKIVTVKVTKDHQAANSFPDPLPQATGKSVNDLYEDCVEASKPKVLKELLPRMTENQLQHMADEEQRIATINSNVLSTIRTELSVSFRKLMLGVPDPYEIIGDEEIDIEATLRDRSSQRYSNNATSGATKGKAPDRSPTPGNEAIRTEENSIMVVNCDPVNGQDGISVEAATPLISQRNPQETPPWEGLEHTSPGPLSRQRSGELRSNGTAVFHRSNEGPCFLTSQDSDTGSVHDDRDSLVGSDSRGTTPVHRPRRCSRGTAEPTYLLPEAVCSTTANGADHPLGNVGTTDDASNNGDTSPPSMSAPRRSNTMAPTGQSRSREPSEGDHHHVAFDFTNTQTSNFESDDGSSSTAGMDDTNEAVEGFKFGKSTNDSINPEESYSATSPLDPRIATERGLDVAPDFTSPDPEEKNNGEEVAEAKPEPSEPLEEGLADAAAEEEKAAVTDDLVITDSSAVQEEGGLVDEGSNQNNQGKKGKSGKRGKKRKK